MKECPVIIIDTEGFSMDINCLQGLAEYAVQSVVSGFGQGIDTILNSVAATPAMSMAVASILGAGAVLFLRLKR